MKPTDQMNPIAGTLMGHWRQLLVLVLLASCTVTEFAPAQARPLNEVFNSVSSAVVVVYTRQREIDNRSQGGFVNVGGVGSGVLISDDQVMTAAHVVQTAERVLVEFPNGQRIPARIVASAPAADVALLQLEQRPSRTVPARLGNSDSAKVGDQVFVVGAPFGISHTLTVGHISARRKQNRTFGGMLQAEFLQTDAAINRGNSGGPMFNMRGEVIGIASYIISSSGGFQGLGFVVTSNVARELLLTRPTPWTGLEGLLLTGEVAGVFNVPPPGGILVQRVAGGSPAARLGLRPGSIPAKIGDEEFLVGGDIIVEVLGIKIDVEGTGYERIQEALRRLGPGDLLQVTVLRDGKLEQLSASYQP